MKQVKHPNQIKMSQIKQESGFTKREKQFTAKMDTLYKLIY